MSRNMQDCMCNKKTYFDTQNQYAKKLLTGSLCHMCEVSIRKGKIIMLQQIMI